MIRGLVGWVRIHNVSWQDMSIAADLRMTCNKDERQS